MEIKRFLTGVRIFTFRIIAVALALSLTFMLFSCDDDDDDDSSSNPPGGNNDDDGSEVSLPGAPSFNPAGGFYNSEQTLKITCSDDKDAKIYYYILKKQNTEEAWRAEVLKSNMSIGNDDFKKGTLYDATNPPKINEQCIVRAMAKKSSGERTYSMTAFDFDTDTTNATSQTLTDSATFDWSDGTMYFILTDRFNKGTGTTAPAAAKDSEGNAVSVNFGNDDGYYGGNLKGIEEKLDYIKGMGFTSIFITPPTESQEAIDNYHGYHGYWTSNFTKVDPHAGDLAAYKSLVAKAHEKGLRVVQDFNVNNVGDYMRLTKDYTEYKGTGAGEQFTLLKKSAPLTHPAQLPWALNDLNDLTEGEFSGRFYNYEMKSNANTSDTMNNTKQLQDLDDIRTSSVVVQSLMRGYARYWIDKVGIDGYRFNNAYGVETAFFDDFVNKTGDDAGALVYGKAKKNNGDFLVFGEGQSIDETPNDEVLASYTQKNGKDLLGSVQYSSLRIALNKAIIDGNDAALYAVLTKRGTAGYKNTDRLVTFVDNHDTARWREACGNDDAKVKMGYNIIYTIPGIPQVYYGSEQDFTGKRDPMFAQNTPNLTSSTDHFSNTSTGYKYFKALNKMRSTLRATRHGTVTVLTPNNTNGLYAHLVASDDTSVVGKKILVVQNSSNEKRVLTVTNDKLLAGEVYKAIDGLTITNTSEVAANDSYTITTSGTDYAGISSLGTVGNALTDTITVYNQPFDPARADVTKTGISIEVPAGTCGVYVLYDVPDESTTLTTGPKITMTFDGDTGNILDADDKHLILKGTTSAVGDVKAIIDDDYANPIATQTGAAAGTEFTLDCGTLSGFSYGAHYVKLTQEVSGTVFSSASKAFQIVRLYKYNTEVIDKASDCKGVSNSKLTLDAGDVGISIPLYDDGSMTGTMDIRGVEVYTSGTNIRLGLRVSQITHQWAPNPNSFDHVAFYVLINTDPSASPDTGCDLLPKSHYTLPAEFGKWNYLYSCDGWHNNMYEATGASATNWGAQINPVPSNKVAIDWDKITMYKDSETGKVYNYAKMEEKWMPWSATGYAPLAKGTAWTNDTTPPVKHNIPGIIWFDIPAASIGKPASLTGIKILVATYDYDNGSQRELLGPKVSDDKADGGIRDINDDDKKWKFSTKGDPATVPMVADMTDSIITLQ